jgi:hypothetical protein
VLVAVVQIHAMFALCRGDVGQVICLNVNGLAMDLQSAA